MLRIEITAAEHRAIESLLQEVTSRYEDAEEERFLDEVGILAHDLPRRLRLFLNDFRLSERAPNACIISGYPIDDHKIGKTPLHWNDKSEASHTMKEEVLLLLLASLLGDAFGWATEQGGRIVHEVFPIKENRRSQISTGSEQPIYWHTEDAFNVYSCDYLGLVCLRNRNNVASTYASVDSIKLSAKDIDILFEPRFVIHPDVAHQVEHGSGNNDKDSSAGLLEVAYRHIEQMNRAPQRLAVLFGSRSSPYIRIDPYFMDPLESDPEAGRALRALTEAIDNGLSEFVLKPGDYFFIDNYKAVHGRRSFKAKYDGADRWLKRVNITRDLRKSRHVRPAAESRILF
jgi:Fe(II)/alpha-ketoglutarate-dependent arginine beta-hydroxylase